MPQLFFIRHGQTKANIDGILTGTIETDLTQKGIEDAKKLAQELTEKFNYYYCSPLKRTQQTLNAIKGDVEFFIDERIIEVSTGDWEGKLKTELPEEKYNLYKKGLFNPPNGEDLEKVDKRIKSFLEDMFEKYKKEDKILVVTHNAFMRSLKRLFVDKNKVVEPKNLEIFIVDDDMYRKMKKQ